MRERAKKTRGALLLLALLASSCGATSPNITISFKSPALIDGALPTVYTCDGRDISPPLEWGAVPSSTRELAVFVLGLTPNKATGRYKVSVEWVVAGLNPALHQIPAGTLPPTAHVGRSSAGKTRYSICPAAGRREHYQFALYAVPASIEIPAKFDGPELLHVLANPKSEGASHAGGGFATSYTRRPPRKPAGLAHS